MAIEITCECGKACRVSDDKSGKRFKCRDCGTLVRVPDANSDATDDDVDLGDDDSEVTRVRTTRSNASPKQSWLRIVIPIVIAVVAAVPAWAMFGVMLLEPRSFDEFIQGLLAGLGVFVAVGALPWFLYVNLIPKPASQEPEVDAPGFSADSLVWQTDDRKGKPMSVIVDRAAGMIHFQNCAIRTPFLLGWALPWFSCPLSGLRSFHIRYTKTGGNLVIKTDVGKVTVVYLDNSFPAIVQTLDDMLPGGHRRFHEDHTLAILLFLLAGVSGAVLALFLIPDRLSPQTAQTVVLGSGVAMTLAVRWAISFWSGRRARDL